MAVLVADCGVYLSWTSLLGLQNISKTAVGIAESQRSPQLTAQSELQGVTLLNTNTSALVMEAPLSYPSTSSQSNTFCSYEGQLF